MIFSIQLLDEGATPLWEEFAPRSRLCHAWGAICVDCLLPDDQASS